MTSSRQALEIKNRDVFCETFNVSRETADRLSLFEDLLKNWQRTINLVSPSTLDQVWHRHFADSAQLLALAPENARVWVDLGSGAGFPGMVLAILRAGRGLESDKTPHILIESDQRKAAFLREVSRQTGVCVDIIAGRIEFSSTHDRISQVDIVSARALAPLPKLLSLAAGFLATGGRGLFLKGRDARTEVANAKREWCFDCRMVASVTDPIGRVVVVENLKETNFKR